MGVNGVAALLQCSPSWYRFFKDIIAAEIKAVPVGLTSALSERGGSERGRTRTAIRLHFQTEQRK